MSAHASPQLLFNSCQLDCKDIAMSLKDYGKAIITINLIYLDLHLVKFLLIYKSLTAMFFCVLSRSIFNY